MIVPPAGWVKSAGAWRVNVLTRGSVGHFGALENRARAFSELQQTPTHTHSGARESYESDRAALTFEMVAGFSFASREHR
jgi:hypothetical protein